MSYSSCRGVVEPMTGFTKWLNSSPILNTQNFYVLKATHNSWHFRLAMLKLTAGVLNFLENSQTSFIYIENAAKSTEYSLFTVQKLYGVNNFAFVFIVFTANLSEICRKLIQCKNCAFWIFLAFQIRSSEIEIFENQQIQKRRSRFLHRVQDLSWLSDC